MNEQVTVSALSTSVDSSINATKLARRSSVHSSDIDAQQLLPESIRRILVTDQRAFARAIEVWIFVLNAILQSIDSLSQGDLRSFDPLIGNNSCYLSSTITVRIAQSFNKESSKRQRVNSLRERLIKALKDAGSLSAVLSIDIPRVSFGEIIAGVDLPLDIYYLTMSYGCSTAKRRTSQGTDEIDYSRLGLASKKGASGLIKHWQRELSYLGIEYLQDVGSRLWGDNALWAKYIQSPHILVDQRERLCSSSLYSTKVLLSDFSFSSSDVVALDINLYDEHQSFIHRFPIFYRGCSSTGVFTKLSKAELDEIPNHPVWVIAGCSHNVKHKGLDVQTIEHIYSKYDLQYIVMAHEVTYPQYPKSFGNLAIAPTEPKLIDEIKSFRKVRGFSICDPSILCLVHLYADTVSRQRTSSLRYAPERLPTQQTWDNNQS